LYIEFPIEGEFRLPLLALEWIFSFIAFQLGLVFLFRYRKQEKNLRNLQELGYASLLIGLSMMWIFFIGGDYYASAKIERPFYFWPAGSERMALNTLGYISIMFGAFFCIFFMEKYKVYFFKRYLYTLIYSAQIILFLVVCAIDLTLSQTLSFLFWPLFLIFFIRYMIDFSMRAQNKEMLLGGIVKFLSGFILIAIGFMFTTDFMINIFDLQGRLLGAIFQLISVAFIFYFLITLPPFSEFEWEDKLEHLFLINKGGICLYSHSFKDEEIVDENLISGAISSVNVLLGEMTEGRGATILKREGKIITIFPGQNVFGVLFSSEDLNTPKTLLKKFISEFERIYHETLDKWEGDLDVFKPVETLTMTIFK